MQVHRRLHGIDSRLNITAVITWVVKPEIRLPVPDT